jgi:hypothetical protein
MYAAVNIGVVQAVKVVYRLDHGEWPLGGCCGIKIHQGLAMHSPGQYGEILADLLHIQGIAHRCGYGASVKGGCGRGWFNFHALTLSYLE